MVECSIYPILSVKLSIKVIYGPYPSPPGCQSSRFMTLSLSHWMDWMCVQALTLHILSICQSNIFVTPVIYDACSFLAYCQSNKFVTLSVTFNGAGRVQKDRPCWNPCWGVLSGAGFALYFLIIDYLFYVQGVCAWRLCQMVRGCFFYDLLCLTTLTRQFWMNVQTLSMLGCFVWACPHKWSPKASPHCYQCKCRKPCQCI